MVICSGTCSEETRRPLFLSPNEEARQKSMLRGDFIKLGITEHFQMYFTCSGETS
jgi:hypothetical protein